MLKNKSILERQGLFSIFKISTLQSKIIFAFGFVITFSITVLAVAINQEIRIQLTRQIGLNLQALAQSQAQAIGNEVVKQVEIITALGQNTSLGDKVSEANASYIDASAVDTQIAALDTQWRTANTSDNNEDPLVRKVLFNNVADELRKFRDKFPEHGEIFVTDKYGANVAATNRTSDYYQADEDWWQSAYDGGAGSTYIGQPEFDESSQINAMIIAVPIFDDETGKIMGILRTTYNVLAIYDLLESTRFGETGISELFFPGGESLSSKVGHVDLSAEELVQIETLIGSYGQFNHDGTPKFVSPRVVTALDLEEGALIEHLGWILIAQQDSAEALRPVQQAQQITLIISLVILVLTAIPAVSLARNITNPISRLSLIADRVTAGDLNVQVPVESNDEIGTLADTFNVMTTRLRETLSGLEERVQSRTKDLQERTNQLTVISEIARSVATVKETNRLLSTITRLVSERFNFYHVGIFLLDPNKEYAILSAANSKGGQAMLARGHRLRVGQQGIVGFVTHSGLPRTALDVGADAVFFNNPDLPETHSEIALPLKYGQEIIGALDIQSTEINAFSEDEVEIFSILADQVSVAIQNARYLDQIQSALREAEVASGQLTEKTWDVYTKIANTKGYRYDGIKPEPLKESARSVEDTHVLSIPVELRGKTIGRLKLRAVDQSRTWSEDELAIIKSTAEQMAVALESARLLEDAQKRASRESFLSEVAAKLGASFQLDSILRDTVEELGQTLKGSRVSLQLVNPSAPPSTKKSGGISNNGKGLKQG